MSTTLEVRKRSRRGRPAAVREMQEPFPRRTRWTEDEYLDISTNHLVEFTDGLVKVLPMPTPFHQAVSKRLLIALDEFVRVHKLGEVFHCPVPLWTGVTRYREPDLLFVSTAHLSKTWKRDRKLNQADLVVEILSEGVKNRRRDLIQKKTEYANAGIPEYWIVDPQESRVTVLKLRQSKYVTLGHFGLDDEIRSALLPNFRLPVRDLF